MIKREKYIAPIREFYDSDLIKIITGIRRCGKSVVLQQIMEEISLRTDNIIYLNFEDRRVSANIANAEQLTEYVDQHRKAGKCYLFFDEIQVLDQWQQACKTLRLENCSLFITGSNSRLLSREFTKELSGRYVSFRIRPFVYKELVLYAKQLGRECSVTDYLVWGGFPKRLEFATEQAQRVYLGDLDDTVVLNDLINRYKIRKTALFERFVNYVLRSNGRIFSANSIVKYINQFDKTCSLNTVIKYLGYLQEAYVIQCVRQYSAKTKAELQYFTKLYDEDVCFNSIRCADNRFDLTHNLENIVYNELIYMGYSVFVYNNNGKEIDFLAQDGNKRYLIQVAYSVAEDKAYQREFGAFDNIDNSAKKIVISNDEIDYSTATVQHLRLKDFLLMEKL